MSLANESIPIGNGSLLKLFRKIISTRIFLEVLRPTFFKVRDVLDFREFFFYHKSEFEAPTVLCSNNYKCFLSRLFGLPIERVIAVIFSNCFPFFMNKNPTLCGYREFLVIDSEIKFTLHSFGHMAPPTVKCGFPFIFGKSFCLFSKLKAQKSITPLRATNDCPF